jgi:hypothetical protein
LEFVSPILYGDQGLVEIKSFCKLAKDRRWKTNRYCGYHAHFDASEETWESLRSIAYAYRKTYEVWCCFVSDSRSSNPMCGAPDYNLGDIANLSNAEDWEYFAAACDRFEWLNWRAYMVHGTLEFRSHDPSLNAVEICNWIKVHARFIDFVKSWSLADLNELFNGSVQDRFKAISDIVGSELADYYANRAECFGKPVVKQAQRETSVMF